MTPEEILEALAEAKAGKFLPVATLPSKPVSPEVARDWLVRFFLGGPELFKDSYSEAVESGKQATGKIELSEPQNGIIGVVLHFPDEAEHVRETALLAEFDPYHFDVAKTLAVGHLKEGRQLPPELSIFAARVLAGELQRPRQYGASSYKNSARNHIINLAISMLVQVGMTATRNEASYSKDSVCDIVAEVLLLLGLPLGYEGVRTIYKNSRQRLLRESN